MCECIIDAAIDQASVRNIEYAINDVKDKFGMDFTEVKKGYASARLQIRKKHLNAFGICYGNFLFNLADITAGVAFLSMTGFGPTLTGNISFIKGAKEGDTLICTASVQKHGKRISFCTAEIRTPDDTLIAKMDFTYFSVSIPG